MKTKLLLIITLVITLSGLKNVNAQSIAAEQYYNIQPFLNYQHTEDKKAVDVAGTPYLNDQWAMGVVKLADGRTYKDVPLKYDETQGELYFQDKKEQTLTFVDPVSEFKINYIANDRPKEETFKNGFKNIPGSSELSFFEVLSDGTAQLIKKTAKIQAETKEYNRPLIKSFQDDSKYYLIVSGKVLPFKRDKKFILASLCNKQAELERYMKNNNVDLKSDADLSKLITYYNSL